MQLYYFMYLRSILLGLVIVTIHAKNATAAWNLPILSTRILGYNDHAKRRYHGISPGFPVHYQDLEYWARNSEKQAAVAFLAWQMG